MAVERPRPRLYGIDQDREPFPALYGDRVLQGYAITVAVGDRPVLPVRAEPTPRAWPTLDGVPMLDPGSVVVYDVGSLPRGLAKMTFLLTTGTTRLEEVTFEVG